MITVALLLGGFSLFTAGVLVAIGTIMRTAKGAGNPTFGALIAMMFVPFYTVSLIRRRLCGDGAGYHGEPDTSVLA
ncbi:hypothetical protein [Arthrobacter sp. ISL-28]|uniref:hypothetical protein n=1 Tax=Arthrobacter sp. ISL-28 TaxID=2819108 RepID=UPI0020353BD3|nr:hypothetical protein [Arthrobacter sp. ISL-28]